MKRAVQRVLFFTLAGLSTAHAGPSALPEPGATDEGAAKAAGERAAAAFKAKKWGDAKRAGLEQYAAGGGAEALETVAVAALQLGEVPLSFQCYEAILADPAASAGTRGRAKKQHAALSAQTGGLTVNSNPTGARIYVGALELGRTPMPPLRIFPGKVDVTAEFGDGQRETKKVDVVRGGARTVDFSGSASEAVAAPVESSVPAVPALAGPVLAGAALLGGASALGGEPAPSLAPSPAIGADTAAPMPTSAAPTDPTPAPTSSAASDVPAEAPVASVEAGPANKNPVLSGMDRLALTLVQGMVRDDPKAVRRLAVMPFESLTKTQEIDSIGSLSADLLSARFATQPRLLQVERQRLNALVSELERAEGGKVTPESAVGAGTLLGANTVILGSIGEAGSDYLVTARVVDVETARVLSAGDQNIPRAGLVALNENAVELKSPANAAFRSAAVPGWGQFYNGDTVRGVVYLSAFASAAAVAIGSGVLGAQAEDEYNRNIPSTVDEREKGNAHYDRVSFALAGMGVVWLASIADAYFTGSDARVVDFSALGATGAAGATTP